MTQSIESEGHVSLGLSRLHYFRYGSGKKTLLLFHGFGQDHTAFDSSMGALLNDCTVYSFDLFYHGKSDRPDALMRPEEWLDCIRLFLQKERIESFDIGAYSLGGRFALQVVKNFHPQIGSVVLIAPDGFYLSPFYKAAVKFRAVFKFLMHHPTAFHSFLNFAAKGQLFNKSFIKFGRRELQYPEDRARAYRTWTYFQKLYLSKKELVESLANEHISINFYLGSQDYIIPAREVLKTIGSLKNINVQVMEKRHNEVLEEAFNTHFR